MCVSEKKVEHTDKARGYSRVGGEGGERERVGDRGRRGRVQSVMVERWMM